MFTTINEQQTSQNPSFPFQFSSLDQHLNLALFKMFPCQYNTIHKDSMCPFFHGSNDKRREASLYSSKLCENYMNCPLGDQCCKSHNKYEFLYHPENYKTVFCRSYLKKENCELGVYCPFAHCDNEIKSELLHHMNRDQDFFMFYYKTVFCPYLWNTHVFGKCVYAHFPHKIRRKPHLFDYGTNKCLFFSKENINSCPFGDKCKDAHGENEVEFHPLNYKTTICRKQNCFNQETCPKAHNNMDFRFYFLFRIY